MSDTVQRNMDREAMKRAGGEVKEESREDEALERQTGRTGRRPRRYSDPVPSEHCHVCCRPVRTLRFAVCSNIDKSLCRKVICIKCFESFQWDYASAVAPDSTWTCTHCQDLCPRCAQCFVYERINSQRKKRSKGASAKRSREET
eukprot:Plantae.Rhodophyta-Purpureofilum_apyrenoidigerum.ctg28299.p2 GENE.Plantae.Rhodophyta-Purpureofilum_apyrenoidigerum.ctg28299~~Plantae.Rhodophyta-Purpureofilum_apyrenoidigerum.ctg28299.p2  ORF type:complete len:145 (-),score=15.03 Plantae.Rhodophyta-Purpureofilum_apyrenoidigerum.ctg28299:146-580(-)